MKNIYLLFMAMIFILAAVITSILRTGKKLTIKKGLITNAYYLQDLEGNTNYVIVVKLSDSSSVARIDRTENKKVGDSVYINFYK